MERFIHTLGMTVTMKGIVTSSWNHHAICIDKFKKNRRDMKTFYGALGEPGPKSILVRRLVDIG